MANEINRRALLKSGATALAAGLTAGCQQDGGGERTKTQEEQTPTSTPEPNLNIELIGDTNIELFFQPGGMQNPDLDIDQLTRKLRVSGDVDSDIQIIGRQGGDKVDTGDEGEVIAEVSGEGEETINATDLPWDHTKLEAEAQLGEGETVEAEEPAHISKVTPPGHRVDVRDQDDENINDYETPFQFDRFTFNPDRLEKNRQEWLEDAAWNGDDDEPGLIDAMRNDEALTHQYVVTDYPNDSGNGGRWKLNDFQDEGKFHNILRFTQSASRAWQQKVEGDAASAYNFRFAATTEIATEEIHPKFNGTDNDYDIRAGYVSTYGWGNEGNHGLYVVYADTPGMGDDIKGAPVGDYETDEEVRWWLVETTNDEISPVSESSYSAGGSNVRKDGGNYMPFTQGFETHQTVETNKGREMEHPIEYERRKSDAASGLTTLVNTTGGDDNFNWATFMMGDRFVEEAYDHILENDGKAEKIIEPLEKAVDKHVQHDDTTFTGIYGSLENPRILEAEGERGDDSLGYELWEMMMDDKKAYKYDQIEEKMVRDQKASLGSAAS